MEIFWNLFFWIAVISVTAIIAAVITNAVNRNAETRKYLADAQNGGNYKGLAEETLAANEKLLARLDVVEERLASIEKTLTDIP